ncbi:MAG: hypothetical protein P1P88_02220 [Bacteroidales bacterium]|nr:hypothetical protein [Bacteroidales bacterium]
MYDKHDIILLKIEDLILQIIFYQYLRRYIIAKQTKGLISLELQALSYT